MHYFFFGVCSCYIIVALITDIRFMKIPNVLTIPSIIMGVVGHTIHAGFSGLSESIIGLTVSFIIMFILYVFGVVGAGDVKLFGGIGAWTGAWFSIHTIVYSLLYAGIVSVFILCIRRDGRQRMHYLLHTCLSFVGRTYFLKQQPYQLKYLKFPFMVVVTPAFITNYLYTFIL